MARAKKNNDENDTLDDSPKTAKSFDLDKIRKELKDSVINLDESYKFFLTGNPLFDAYVGSGGLPKYQMEYIWGKNSIGKSTLAQQFLASYQKQFKENCIQVYFDKEESLTKLRLKSLGVQPDQVVIVSPETIEFITDKVCKWAADYKNVDIFVVWDTIAMTPSQEEVDGKDQPGTQARALAKMFKRVKFLDFKTTMFILNQFREKIGERYPTKEPPGGNAVKHKSFLSIEGHSKKSEIWPENANVGKTTVFDTVKSKIISPFRKMTFEYTYVYGYDAILTMINYMWKEMKILSKKSGRWQFASEEETYSLKQLYKYFMTDESVYRWKLVINDIYENLYPDDDKTFINDAKNRIFNYYFKGDKLILDNFTSIRIEVVEKDFDSIRTPSVEGDSVDDAVANLINNSTE